MKMESILQVITSFYRRPEVLILVPFTRVIFTTPIISWVMKHLYRVKYLQSFLLNTRVVFLYPHNWLGYETLVSNKNYYKKKSLFQGLIE